MYKKDFDGFPAAMRAEGTEVKRGGHLAFKIPNDKRLIRCDSLGADYSKAAVQDILCGEAVNHKSAVYLPGEAISVNLSFRDLLSSLPGDMFCHYSFVVNLKHVHKRTAHGLLLDTGMELSAQPRLPEQEIARQFVAFLK